MVEQLKYGPFLILPSCSSWASYLIRNDDTKRERARTLELLDEAKTRFAAVQSNKKRKV